MVKGVSRTHRISQALQKEIAVILLHEVRDPRIGTVSLTGVEVSRDLAFAKVFVTFFEQIDEKSKIQEGLAALQQAAVFIRSRLGTTLRLRLIPQLRFLHDPSLAQGMYINQLLAKVIKPLPAVQEPPEE